MSLTSIGSQRTPGRPIEITFAADTGTPTDDQELLLIGHRGTSPSGTAVTYAITTIDNAGDLALATTEANGKFGSGSELAKMVIAAVTANVGGSTFPKIKCMPLAAADTGFGTADVALTNSQNTKAEFVVSPYDGNDSTTRNKLKDHALLVSGAQRVENNQFGTFGVVANKSVTAASSLPTPDTQFIVPVWLRDTGSNPYSLGEIAAASAAKMASNIVPFNPLDSVTIPGITAPASSTDYITVGAGLESETALGKGWIPLYVKPNGEVAFVRTITSRISADGSGTPIVGSYYDVQDFQVLYYWRKTLFTRFSQPDFKRRKASSEAAGEVKAELIRLAKLFEDNNMFQAVSQLAKFFQVERSLSDRHRFDYKTPVNVIPGLHVIAGNIEASTEFDTITI